LLVIQLSACTSWRVQNAPPQQFTVQDASKPIRVVRRNGAALTLQGTRVSGDTLYGTNKRYGVADSLVAIPLSEIRTIEVRQGSTGKTVGLIAGITVGVAGAIVLFFVVTCALCLG
jgi:hypothetical protein